VAGKQDLVAWVREALWANGGRGSVVDVSRFIWEHHEPELRQSGDLFYTWQYDIRWAATQLRHQGILKPVGESPRGLWELL
jgi:hypothetical protein